MIEAGDAGFDETSGPSADRRPYVKPYLRKLGAADTEGKEHYSTHETTAASTYLVISYGPS